MMSERQNLFLRAGKSLLAWRLVATALVCAFAAPTFAAVDIGVTVSGNGATRSTTITSPLFTTSTSNELLVALIATDRQNATVQSVTGGGVTWQLVTRASHRGSAEIWAAMSPTELVNASVTARLNSPSVAIITIMSFGGVNTSGLNALSAIGATGSQTGESSLPTVSLVATRANSFVIGVASDPGLSTARVIGPGQSLVHQYMSPDSTYWVQQRTLPTSSAGSTVTLNTTAPSTRRWQMAAVEIIPAVTTSPVTYNVSGTISPALVGAGALVSFGNGQTTTADLGGNFSFAGLTNGTYTVTPSKTGVTFSPTNQTITVADANVTGVNFTATSLTYTVSGAIAPSSAGSGATVALSNGQSIVADGAGNYSFTGIANGTYTVTPSKTGVVFSPANQAITIADANVTGVNFAATTTTTDDPRATTGEWSAPFDVGMVAVNMVMLHTGKVLMFSGTSFNGDGFVERLWDPATGTITLVPNPFYNLFCSAATPLSDGRILVAGGYDPASLGARNANVFDPVTQTWSALPNMAFRRWYPGVTALPDGRALVTSGGQSCLTCLAELPEIYDPATNTFTTLSTARLAMPFYPFPFVLPDGKIVNAGATENAFRTSMLDLTTNLWTTVDANVRDGHSAAMYLPGRILKSGTAADSGTAGSALATAFVIDMTAPAPAWRQIASMAFRRAFHNMTLLPDGQVLVTGGTTGLDGYDGTLGIKQAELWSPVTETWQTLAAAAIPRLYHSTALLLPDGRVLTAGSGMDGPGINQRRAEIFSPPYLFKGARPVITTAPAQAQYGTTFRVDTPDAARIARISLIRAGAATHGIDYSQRFVPLAFTASAGTLNVEAPANANIAPPGYYMLFIVDDAGVPSVASWVWLPPAGVDVEPPNPPTDLVADAAIGSASLTWTAATDNTGVTLYNVHRAASSGVTPSTRNRIGQTIGTSFRDINVSAGAHYYVVTAQDVAGNVSAASNEASAVVLADVTAPAVALSAPADGTTVSGSTVLSATASDDVGVQSVQFTIDGAPLGVAVTVAPYSTTWISGTTSNGLHTIGAIARDAAGNVAEATITVTVSNTAQTPNGLVAAYGFNEPAGSAAVVDASGQGNEGIISGAIRTSAGRFGGALSFDGTSSWVTVADAPSLDLTDGITISAWVNPTARTSWRTVVLKEASPGLAYALYAANDALKPAGYINVFEDTAVTAPADLLLNVWTHLAFTFDGGVMRLYVNGTEVSTTNIVGSTTVSNGPLRIGGNSVWGEYFRGVIDEVRVYNRALSSAEIGQDMVTPIP